MRIAIIGAGITGLTCAHHLTKRGVAVAVFDKGRGLGGRMATRRTEHGFQFDHGAQYISTTESGFRQVLSQCIEDGFAAPWSSDDDARDRIVGIPGMTGIAKAMARGLSIHQRAEVTHLSRHRAGWALRIGAEEELFDRVICTAPAPQADKLLGPSHPMANALADVEFAPSLTLMLALPSEMRHPFTTRRDPDDAIAWLALDSDKPGRAHPQCWVAQASEDWSRAHLELERADMTALMLPMVCSLLDVDPAIVRHAAAHRWRYAFATRPLGAPFLCDDDKTLYLGGDWCLGHKVEAAWTSGTAIAEDVLRALARN